ncbi:hypothetical protein ACFRAR_08070 [Kitasatospora sp. NPDC056651]|uniref:hypothetical protein n=1 Tax=Kitasatospora sp. NPDC056651 TaxID=3345892 RepID=UPI00368E4EE8
MADRPSGIPWSWSRSGSATPPQEPPFAAHHRPAAPDRAVPGPGASAPDAPTGPPPWRTAGRFGSAAGALACASALAGAGGERWACYRTEPARWWLLSSLGPLAADAPIRAAGGRPAAVSREWIVGGEAGRDLALPTVLAGVPVDALELAAGCPVSSVPPAVAPARVAVLTVPQLLPSALRRAAAAGVDASLLPVVGGPLHGGREQAAETLTHLLLLSAPGEGGTAAALPARLVGALARLPRTAVCGPDGSDDRLLLDLRLRLPGRRLPLPAAVPDGELWLVTEETELPPQRLRVCGEPLHLADAVPAGPVPALPAHAAAPAPVAPPPAPFDRLRVLPGRAPDERVAGVLLDDGRLDLLRRYLPGRPLGERAFLLLGDGLHLLLEPTPLIAALPFGDPCYRLGVGNCFVDAGHVLTPALPPGALVRTLGLDAETVVVARPDGFHRFDLTHLVPAWTLWAPPAPPQRPPGLSPTARALLAAAEQLLGAASVQAPPGAAPADPTDLLARATRLHAEGRYAEAAECYRLAGDPRRAGHLYERAAAEAVAEP